MNWYGFLLSLLTACMWGILPVAFVVLLDSLDALTITWARFTFSALVVCAFLHRRAQLPRLGALDWPARRILVIAIGALLANFLLYVKGLELLNPEATVVLIQLAPFILMVGSVVIHGERFGSLEAAGAALLLLGLGLFFNDRLGDLLRAATNEALGVAFMLLSALSWGIYGLLQKGLLRSMGSVQLTLLLYAGGALALAPFITYAAFTGLSGVQWLALLFCCINMVVGYGAFTEALRVWEGARVSAVIALAPVFAILGMKAAVLLWPADFSSSGLNALAHAGAVLVVAGSMLAALGRGRKT